MEKRELYLDSRKGAKHVLFQDARLRKEVLLGFRERNALTQFQVKEFGAAYEIGNLEQAVIARRDVLHENRRSFGESSLEDAAHLGLSVVVVDFHQSVRRKAIVGIGKEGGDLVEEGFLHGGRRGAVPLVDDEGVVGDWGVECECEKAEENLLPIMDVHKTEDLFSADEGACVDADAGVSEIGEAGVQFGDVARQVRILFVDDKGDDVEARWNGQRIETPRLVNEYAELLLVHDSGNPKKIKMAGRYPRLRVARACASAKSQITPAADSISNRRRRRKGESGKWKCGNEEENEERNVR